MTQIDPYLNFNGNTEEAFIFYRSVFGGEFLGGLMRFSDVPDGEKLNAQERNKIMHVALPIGKGNMIMATDALESMHQKVVQGNNFHINITSDNETELKRLFDGLATGGTVSVPLHTEPWTPLFGMLKDKFGIQWMFNLKKD